MSDGQNGWSLPVACIIKEEGEFLWLQGAREPSLGKCGEREDVAAGRVEVHGDGWELVTPGIQHAVNWAWTELVSGWS